MVLHISVRIFVKALFLLSLFMAPLVEYVWYDGTNYLAALTGVIACYGYILERKYFKDFSIISIREFLVVVAFVFALLNFRAYVEIGLLARILAMLGIWLYIGLYAQDRGYRRLLFVVLILSGVVQACIGVLQSWCLVESGHADFSSTGSFLNPGPWGGYLSVSLTLSCVYLQSGGCKKRYRILIGVAGLIILYALLLSGSRAAVLSFVVAMVVFFILRMSRLSCLLKLKGVIIATMVLGVFTVIAILYNGRPSSANARLRIWEVSARMFRASPVIGHGTGGFGRLFMQTQSEVLRDMDEEACVGASDNTLAYNETVRICCEQGCIGLILYGAIIMLCMIKLYRSFCADRGNVMLFPFLAYLVFSQFSYPSEIWSLYMLFPVFIGISRDAKENICRMKECVWSVRIGARLYAYICMAILSISFIVRLNLNKWLDAYCNFNEQSELKDNKVYQTFMIHDYTTLAYYSKLQMMRNNYHEAIRSILFLRNYKLSVDMTLDLAAAYEAVGENRCALNLYEEAHGMMPGLLTPVFEQFLLYKSMGAQRQAEERAEEIICFREKVNNERVMAMKEEARLFLIDRNKR